MLKETFRIEGKKHPVEIPESWEEISTLQFIRLQKKDLNEFQIFGILCGFTEHEVMNVTSPGAESLMYDTLTWVNETAPDWDKLQKHDQIRLKGQTLKIPKDLSKERIGQKMYMDKLFETYEDPIESVPEAIAIYLQPEIEKEIGFDYDQVKLIQKEIEKIPIIITYPIAMFFFLKLKTWKPFGERNSLPFRKLMTKKLLKRLLNPKGSRHLENWVASSK